MARCCRGSFACGERQARSLPHFHESQHSRECSVHLIFMPPTDFPILDELDFFNHAGVAPLSGPAAATIREYATQAAARAYVKHRHVPPGRGGAAVGRDAAQRRLAP